METEKSLAALTPQLRPAYEKHKLNMGIGIVGYKVIVQSGHMPAYRAAGFRVAGVAEISENCRNAATRDGVPFVTDDYKKLIERDDVDIIDIAIGHETKEKIEMRIEILKSAAKAKKAVLMHKPMATSLEDAERMIHIAEDAGIPFAVNQNQRFHPAMNAAKSLLREDSLGEPQVLQISNIGRGGKANWGSAQGANIAWIVHGIDCMHHLSGAVPQQVYAKIGSGSSTAIFSFSNGAIGNYFEFHSPSSVVNETPFRIWATNGGMRGNDFWNPGNGWMKDSLQVRSNDWAKAFGWMDIAFPDSIGFSSTMDHFGTSRKPNYDIANFWAGFIGTMGDLMMSIEEKRLPIVNGRHNLLSLKMYFALGESARENRPVVIK